MGILKKTVLGIGGAAAATFGAAVYDYGLNEQQATESPRSVVMDMDGVTLHTKSGNKYKTLIGDDLPMGMFGKGGNFAITYTGGMTNALFGVPRNPVAVRKVSP